MVPVMTWAEAEIETINVTASTRRGINRKDFMLTSLVGLVGLGLRRIEKLTVRSVDFDSRRSKSRSSAGFYLSGCFESNFEHAAVRPVQYFG